MTDLPIRYSPSGKIIGTPGRGFRLRLSEVTTTMSGTVDVPFPAGVISPIGFGGPAFAVQMIEPKPDLRYRVNLGLDLVNVSSSVQGGVTLFLDTTQDGVTWTNRAKNFHWVGGAQVTQEGRFCKLNIDLALGSELGIVAGAGDLLVRARAELSLGTTGSVQVSSVATSPGGSPVTGLNGTIHLEIEECL